jgi:hypothetical protein
MLCVCNVIKLRVLGCGVFLIELTSCSGMLCVDNVIKLCVQGCGVFVM